MGVPSSSRSSGTRRENPVAFRLDLLRTIRKIRRRIHRATGVSDVDALCFEENRRWCSTRGCTVCHHALNAQNLTLEGQTGGFITPTAYVVFSDKDHIWSHPAVGYHFVNASSVIGYVHTFSIEEGVANRAEFGYTRSVHTKGNDRISAACGITRE